LDELVASERGAAIVLGGKVAAYSFF
jgi:hypothetical protein